MKKLIFTLLIATITFAAEAQVGYNYNQYELGASAGFNSAVTDFKASRKSYAFGGHFTYNYTPYVNFIAELQVGAVKADSLNNILPGTFYNFTNDYTTVAFRAQLQLGELMDYSQSPFKNIFKNFYVSTGVGVIYTDLKVFDADQLATETKGSNLFIPAKFGYEFKVFNNYNEPFLKFDVGYQVNLILSDAFDGISSGRYNDAFTQFVIGVKFGIGGKTSYRKAINY